MVNSKEKIPSAFFMLASVEFPKFNTTYATVCFSMWYHMLVDGGSTMAVYLNRKNSPIETIWQQTHSQYDKWHHMSVTIHDFRWIKIHISIIYLVYLVFSLIFQLAQKHLEWATILILWVNFCWTFEHFSGQFSIWVRINTQSSDIALDDMSITTGSCDSTGM